MPAKLQSSWQDISNGNLALDVAEFTEDTNEKNLLSPPFPHTQIILAHRFKEVRRCVDLAFQDPETETGLRQWHQAHRRLAVLGNHHLVSAQRCFDQLGELARGCLHGMG